MAGRASELGGVPLTNHFGETAARFASELLPHDEEIIVERIEALPTYPPPHRAWERVMRETLAKLAETKVTMRFPVEN